MSANEHFEDDDLALYAMRLLAEPEASAMTRRLAESEEGRQRLALVQARLAGYAEASIKLQEAPEGSLERLMGRIAQEKRAGESPSGMKAVLTEHTDKDRGRARAVMWIGWALAAGLAITVGKLYHDQTGLKRDAVATSLASAEASKQRDMMRGTVTAQQHQIQQLTIEAVTTRTKADRLQSKNQDQTTQLNQQQMALAEAERQRQILQETVAAQANQVAGLTTDAITARRVTETLTDPTALKVTLTKPKSHPAPNGRAVYVARRQTLVFLASNLAPLKNGKVYQLWLMPADGSSPIPAGTFSADAQGNASVVYEQLPRPVDAKGFGVTIENSGGAHTPTLPLVLAGTASS